LCDFPRLAMLFPMKTQNQIATRNARTRELLPLVTMFALLCVGGNSALAGFKGVFAPGNWRLTTNEASAALDLTAAPRQVTFVCSGNEAAWSVQIPLDGEVTFDWEYTPPPSQGVAGYIVDSSAVELTSAMARPDRGHAVVAVRAGRPFSFWIRSDAKSPAPGRLVIRNFSYNGAPRIQHLGLGKSDVQVTFESVPGRVHRVQSCSDLGTRAWVDCSPDLVALDNETLYSTGRRAGDTMFFRIVLLPEEE
jgi:hypothetical protein